jgi:hypothetical protein
VDDGAGNIILPLLRWVRVLSGNEQALRMHHAICVECGLYCKLYDIPSLPTRSMCHPTMDMGHPSFSTHTIYTLDMYQFAAGQHRTDKCTRIFTPP